MNFLSYGLTALISFTGLIAGLVIMRLAKEEQKPGKKYFQFLQKTILTLIIISLFYYYKLGPITIFIALYIALVQLIKRYKNMEDTYYLYPVLALVFWISKDASLLLIESTLIFIYGLISSSDYLKDTLKENITFILKNTSYMIIVLLLYFLK